MRASTPRTSLLALLIAGLYSATPVFAAEEAKAASPAAEPAKAEEAPNYAESTLTGNWGGARDRMDKAGLVWEAVIKVDSLRNRGAQSNGSKTVSHLDLKLKMDLEKAIGWTGGSGMLNVISDSGRGPNARHVSSHMGVTNLEVPAPTTTRLFHAWLQQSLFDDRLSVLAGIYPIDSEFQTMDSAGVFVKPEYGPTAELALTRGPSVFNNAAFGIRTKLQTADKSVYAQWALMDGIPNDPARPKRTTVKFAKGDGAFNIAEIGWLPEAANDKFEGHAKLAAGVWGYTAKVNDQVDVDAAGNPERRRSRGGYILGERTLVRLGDDSTRFITGFARQSWTDGDSTPLKDTLSLGLHVKGPVASRPDDIIGLAWSRAKLSDKWRTSQAAATPSVDTTSNESAVEVTYRYAVTPYFFIQPNLQRIVNPGGVSGLPAAKLIGARIELAL